MIILLHNLLIPFLLSNKLANIKLEEMIISLIKLLVIYLEILSKRSIKRLKLMTKLKVYGLIDNKLTK